MAQHLRVYMNNPTAGTIDGTEISSGDNSLPLTLILDANNSETKVVKCAVRCDSGYEIEGDTAVYFEGTNAAKWKVAPDDNYFDSDAAVADAAFANVIILSDVDTLNKCFWVKASSSPNENPMNDRSVKLVAEGLVVASE